MKTLDIVLVCLVHLEENMLALIAMHPSRMRRVPDATLHFPSTETQIKRFRGFAHFMFTHIIESMQWNTHPGGVQYFREVVVHSHPVVRARACTLDSMSVRWVTSHGCKAALSFSGKCIFRNHWVYWSASALPDLSSYLGKSTGWTSSWWHSFAMWYVWSSLACRTSNGNVLKQCKCLWHPCCLMCVAHSGYDDTGIVGISARGHGSKAAAIVDVIATELKAITKKGAVSEQELTRAKNVSSSYPSTYSHDNSEKNFLFVFYEEATATERDRHSLKGRNGNYNPSECDCFLHSWLRRFEAQTSLVFEAQTSLVYAMCHWLEPVVFSCTCRPRYLPWWWTWSPGTLWLRILAARFWHMESGCLPQTLWLM